MEKVPVRPLQRATLVQRLDASRPDSFNAAVVSLCGIAQWIASAVIGSATRPPARREQRRRSKNASSLHQSSKSVPSSCATTSLLFQYLLLEDSGRDVCLERRSRRDQRGRGQAPRWETWQTTRFSFRVCAVLKDISEDRCLSEQPILAKAMAIAPKVRVHHSDPYLHFHSTVLSVSCHELLLCGRRIQ